MYFRWTIACSYAVALLRMVTPWAGFSGVIRYYMTLLQPWPTWVKIMSKCWWRPNRKLVEFSAALWFHIIKWCHPKKVTPGTSPPPPPPPPNYASAATVITKEMFSESLQPQILRYHLQCYITEKPNFKRKKKRLEVWNLVKYTELYDAKWQGHFIVLKKLYWVRKCYQFFVKFSKSFLNNFFSKMMTKV